MPGFDFRRVDGNRRDPATVDYMGCGDYSVQDVILPQGAPAECERFALAQVEFRGDLDIDPSTLRGFSTNEDAGPLKPEASKIHDTLALLRAAKRPVLVIGWGVRLCGATKDVRELIDRHRII